jgi:hypothetical protein
MGWLILLIIVAVAGLWQWRLRDRAPRFGRLRAEMDALRREIARQQRR